MKGVLGSERCVLYDYEEVQKKLNIVEELYLSDINIYGDQAIILQREKKEVNENGVSFNPCQNIIHKKISVKELKEIFNVNFDRIRVKTLILNNNKTYEYIWSPDYTYLPYFNGKLKIAFMKDNDPIEGEMFFNEIE